MFVILVVLVRHQRGGVSGERLIVCRFDVDYLADSDVRIFQLSLASLYAKYITLLQVSSVWACGSSV